MNYKEELKSALFNVRQPKNYLDWYVDNLEIFSNIRNVRYKSLLNNEEFLTFNLDLSIDPFDKKFNIINNLVNYRNIFNKTNNIEHNFNNDLYIPMYEEFVNIITTRRNIYVSNLPITRFFYNDNDYKTVDCSPSGFEYKNIEEFKTFVSTDKPYVIFNFEILNDFTIKVRGRFVD